MKEVVDMNAKDMGLFINELRKENKMTQMASLPGMDGVVCLRV